LGVAVTAKVKSMEECMSESEVFFKWLPQYSVKIDAIDAQHQELVNILNRLFIAVSRLEGDRVIAGILDALTDYTRTHFALEEQLMRLAKYPALAEHQEEHRRLMEKLDALCKKHMLEEKPIYFEMLAFLKTWLREHIQGEDVKYSAALQKAGFSVTEWEREANRTFAQMSANEGGQWWKLWRAA
jgi:hemerythrin